MALILSGSIDAGGSANKPQFLGSASYAATASFALNGGGGATVDTGSLLITSSISGVTQSFTKGDATTYENYIDSASFSITASYAIESQLAGDAKDLIVNVRNTSGQTLLLGTPVYTTGVTGDNINISAASASSAATMPAIGLLTQDLSNNQGGNVVLSGKLIGLDTSAFTAGQNIYVAPTGGFTNVKPGGDSTLIQNLAIVGKVNASEGEVVVIGSGRSNDVPNLPTDYIFLGDGNTIQVPLADAITGSLPTGTVSGSAQVTGSVLINAETSSINQENGLVFTKGDGTTINILQSTASFVKSVNGIFPTPSNGNVPVSLASVETGTSASMLAASSSGDLSNGDIWVISGQSGSDPQNGSGSNGQSYIFASSSGLLLVISGEDLASTDARYIQQSGDTMTGQLILSSDPSNVLGATPKQYVDPAFTGSIISSAADGTQTITFRTRGGASENISFNSASYAQTASLLLGTVESASYALTASHVVGGGGGGDISTPVITGIVAQSVEQGSSANFTGLAIQSGNPAMWAIQNTGVMTGSLGTTANISTTNTVSTNTFPNTGTFSSQIYALTALGRSAGNALSVTVTPFTLSSSNAFGNSISDYYIQVEIPGTYPPAGDDGKYVYWSNGVFNTTTNTIDVENTTVTGIDTTDYSIWYNESAAKLLAVGYSSTGTLTNIVSVTVADFTNKVTNQSTTAQTTVTTNEKLGGKLRDKYLPNGYYKLGNPNAGKYLAITPTAGDGIFDDFGTKGNGDWMYGFNLLDDWTISAAGSHMLSPSTNANGAHVFAPGAYFISTTETDFIAFGNEATATSTTSEISWTSTNGVLAPSGSSIIVYFDDSVDTYYLYVDGVQKVNSTSVDNYMSTATTTDPVLHFGDPINSRDFSDERYTIGWPYRIDNLWIANTGTTLDSTDVSELSSHSDISDSTNYASIDFHSQGLTTTPTKGAATLTRGTLA